jgi:hypothetical protein
VQPPDSIWEQAMDDVALQAGLIPIRVQCSTLSLACSALLPVKMLYPRVRIGIRHGRPARGDAPLHSGSERKTWSSMLLTELPAEVEQMEVDQSPLKNTQKRRI